MSRLLKLLSALKAASVWNPANIDPEDFKYRSLKRRWLPLFDLISMLVGFMAVQYGSRILNAQYPGFVVDLFGATFFVVALLALIGVSFPRLGKMEIASKIVMLGLLAGYATTIWVSFFQGEVTSGFVAAMLIYPLIPALMRLEILGEERRTRKDAKK